MKFFKLLKSAYKESSKDHLPRMAAALSYYAIFSFAPLVILALIITSFIIQSSGVGSFLSKEVGRFAGPEVANLLNLISLEAQRDPSGNLITTIFAAIILFFAAGGVFRQARNALNSIWQVPKKYSKKLSSILVKNLVAFIMVAGSGILLSASILFTAAISRLKNSPLAATFGPLHLFELAEIAGSLFLIALLFALLYKVLPNRKAKWSQLWPGALLASAGFVVGKYFIGIYLAISSIGSRLGTAGAVLILLFWIYAVMLLFLFGAEFIKVRQSNR